jgi:hypothetical protein
MAISTITGAGLKLQVTWSAGLTIVGSDYSQVTNPGSITKNVTLGTSVANAAVGGADEIASFIQSISAGAAATIDLTSFTNILQQSGQSLARLKGFAIRLLNVADDATYGTACSGIVVGNTGATAATTPHTLDFGCGSGCTVDVTAAAGAITAVVVNAGGTGYPPSSTFALLVAGGSGGVIAARTNSSGVVTAVVFITGSGGSGYTTGSAAATVPLGYSTVLAGGCKAYLDPSAAGVVVDSTHKSVRVVNLDALVAAACQITFFGGST